jgi:hypothetical protein
MKKPTRYQIGCLYKLSDGNVVRAVSVNDDKWKVKDYSGNTFTVLKAELYVAKRKEMKHYGRAESVLA